MIECLLSSSTSLAGEKTILRVVTPDVPTHLAPAGPLTDSDRQALDLIFEPLVAITQTPDGPRRRPGLADRVPAGEGTQWSFRLRPDAKWSSGQPVTAADVRHGVGLLLKDPLGPLAWDAYLDSATLGSTSDVRLTLRHGAMDPYEVLSFPITPHQVDKGGDLSRRDDPAFAKQPLGSGPFALGDPIPGGKPAGVVFRKNPHHPLANKLPFDEIHWFAAADAKEAAALRPDLAVGFDLPGGETTLTRRVWYVAINHRKPALLSKELRRFLGHSLDRDAIVGTTPRLSVNGLTPRDSWTLAPAKRVAENLFQPDIARSQAKLVAEKSKPIALTFAYPADQETAMAAVIDQWQTAAKAGGLDLTITPRPLPPRELAKALAERDFDLALVAEDAGDSPARLAALFDGRLPALAAGGSNFLGVTDAELQGHIAAAARTRQFPALRSHWHNIHVHLTQSMPLIPLWQHQAHTFLAPGWRVSPFDPLRPFADLATWRK